MMYGPDEEDRCETVHRRVDGHGWLVFMTFGLIASAVAWGAAAPIVP